MHISKYVAWLRLNLSLRCLWRSKWMRMTLWLDIWSWLHLLMMSECLAPTRNFRNTSQRLQVAWKLNSMNYQFLNLSESRPIKTSKRVYANWKCQTIGTKRKHFFSNFGTASSRIERYHSASSMKRLFSPTLHPRKLKRRRICPIFKLWEYFHTQHPNASLKSSMLSRWLDPDEPVGRRNIST